MDKKMNFTLNQIYEFINEQFNIKMNLLLTFNLWKNLLIIYLWFRFIFKWQKY